MVFVVVFGDSVEDDSLISVGITWKHLFGHFFKQFDEFLFAELLLFDFYIVFVIVVVLVKVFAFDFLKEFNKLYELE